MALLGRWSLLLAIAASSSPSCTHRCDERAVAGLTVIVAPGTGSTCDQSITVTVTTIDGEYEERLQPSYNPCLFGGLVERPGTYSVRVGSAAGPAAPVTVVVPMGDCHVEPQVVHVQL
jgi:hypothetical protein